MEYTEKDLVKIAKRENNTKRNYLVVDPLQGKHIPVVPSKALDLFAALCFRMHGMALYTSDSGAEADFGFHFQPDL